MTGDRFSSMRTTLRLFRPALVLQQAGVGVITFLLALVWLRLSDASVLWLFATVVLGFVIVVGFGAAEAVLLLRLAGRSRTRARLGSGALLVFLAVLACHYVPALTDHLQTNDGLRAGYLNSRFSPGARQVFTYEHLLRWFGWGWALLTLLLQGALLALLLGPIAATRTAAAIGRCLRSPAYWSAVLVLFLLAPYASARLTGWVPGHGLGVETLSLVLRLLAVVVLDASSAALLLCAVAACAREIEDQPPATATTPAGTPVVSQPRTAPIP